MAKTQDEMVEFAARATCWSRLGRYDFRVDLSDGTVRVYDSVAGHYSIHHGMTSRSEARIRTMARTWASR